MVRATLLHERLSSEKQRLMRFLVILFPLLMLIEAGCRKENLQSPDPERFKQAILTGNPSDAEREINKVCAGLQVSSDSKADLTRLAAAISSQFSIRTTVLCHECIYTFPAQSEIAVSVTSAGIQKDKIIDICYTGGNQFVFAGMHD
jgi:hypothetical protein